MENTGGKEPAKPLSYDYIHPVHGEYNPPIIPGTLPGWHGREHKAQTMGFRFGFYHRPRSPQVSMAKRAGFLGFGVWQNNGKTSAPSPQVSMVKRAG
jgi:hypothetical protein